MENVRLQTTAVGPVPELQVPAARTAQPPAPIPIDGATILILATADPGAPQRGSAVDTRTGQRGLGDKMCTGGARVIGCGAACTATTTTAKASSTGRTAIIGVAMCTIPFRAKSRPSVTSPSERRGAYPDARTDSTRPAARVTAARLENTKIPAR